MKKIMLLSMVFMVATLFIDAGSMPFLLTSSLAHCDTLDGPVVKIARAALEKGDVIPVLKWVRKSDEDEIKNLFAQTRIVRAKGKEARELADRYFLETLVRLHRAGEGEPYTGLKPSAVEPAVAEADKALESGSVENLVKLITDATAKGIRERFNVAKEAKKHADDSVESGRKFVAAYVRFTHYVERLHLDASAPAEHHHGAPEAEMEHHHNH